MYSVCWTPQIPVSFRTATSGHGLFSISFSELHENRDGARLEKSCGVEFALTRIMYVLYVLL